MVLSDNFLKHAQHNTVVVQQEKVDRVVVKAAKVDSAFGSIMFTSHTVLHCGTIGEKA